MVWNRANLFSWYFIMRISKVVHILFCCLLFYLELCSGQPIKERGKLGTKKSCARQKQSTEKGHFLINANNEWASQEFPFLSNYFIAIIVIPLLFYISLPNRKVTIAYKIHVVHFKHKMSKFVCLFWDGHNVCHYCYTQF